MERWIGTVTHYYDHLGVAVLTLDNGLTLGDTLHICGHSTDLIQRVDSMEIDHQKMQAVGPGADVALKVSEPVHRGASIFLLPQFAGVKPFGAG